MANVKVQLGDMVIVYFGYSDMQALRVETGKTLHTRYGDLKHEDIIGCDYGKKMNLRSGYVQLLRFTPELWNLTLDHRTQIMYLPDISVIITHLDLRPGSCVIEAGTGSGAMTHHIANCVLPNGAVYTFDFHADRVARAKVDFDKHGIGNVVHAAQRDVCAEGFGEEMRGRAHAVVLDLPAAHRAVRHAAAALRPGGRLCTFQPCIEQVMKVHAELTEGANEFADIVTCECLLRPWMVKRCDVESFEFDDGTSTKRATDASTGATVDTVAKNLSESSLTTKANPILRTEKRNQVVAVPSFEARGHTAYLTFATFIRNRENVSQSVPESSQEQMQQECTA